MVEKNPDGVPKQLVVGDHGETDEDSGRETHVEDEDVDVVCRAPTLAISGFKLPGFIFSEIVRRKRMEGQTSSEGVIGTARPLQCEFSNLHTSLAFGFLE